MPKVTQHKKLTDTIVRNLKPVPGVTLLVTDDLCPGLRVRVTPTSQTYFLWRRIKVTDKGPTGRAIGEVGTISLDKARQTARAWIGLIKLGKDPAVLAREAKAQEAAKAANTLRVAWELYSKAIDHQRQADKVRQIFNADILPVLGDVPLHELTRQQVKDCIRDIARRTVHQAFAAFSNLRTFLNWCRDEGDWGLEAVPTDGMKANKIVGKKKKHRKRTLEDDEIFAFWRATRPERWGLVNEVHRRFIRGRWQEVPFIRPDRSSSMRGARVLLLTGARLNEILEADRRELSPDGAVLTVPPERFKSEEAHMIFLPADAQAIIEALPRRNKVRFLFSDDGEHAAKIWTKDRRRIDRRMLLTLKALARLRGDDPQAVTLPPFVLHDLRRTVRTRLSALKVPREIAEMVIGHGQRGLERVYNQHEYADEIRDALEKWAALLARIVSKPVTASVITLGKARKA